jgi:hypothetical protein
MPLITGESLHFSSNILKKPRIFEKASNHFKKASISLKTSSKRIEIFKKNLNHFKKASIFLKISLNATHSLKKSPAF